jgi:hypothetical protein
MTADGSAFRRQNGWGFISRNNDDPTAEATLAFMKQANIPREVTVSWNIIPWWNGTRKITPEELHDGEQCVNDLISLLPNLSAIVMVGQKAAKAKPGLEGRGLGLFVSDHPSPLVRAKFRQRWNAIPSEWAKAYKFVLESEKRRQCLAKKHEVIRRMAQEALEEDERGETSPLDNLL